MSLHSAWGSLGVLERIGVVLTATFARQGWSYCRLAPMQHRGKHATAFTQGSDFTLEPANSILLFKVLERSSYSLSSLSRGRVKAPTLDNE